MAASDGVPAWLIVRTSSARKSARVPRPAPCHRTTLSGNYWQDRKQPKGKAMHSSLPTRRLLAICGLTAVLALTACTQEQQNKFGRGVQNWTGTDGVLDIYAGERLTMRFINIDKMSTGIGTSDDEPRSYRYGYGVPWTRTSTGCRTRARRRSTSRSATTRPAMCFTRITVIEGAKTGTFCPCNSGARKLACSFLSTRVDPWP